MKKLFIISLLLHLSLVGTGQLNLDEISISGGWTSASYYSERVRPDQEVFKEKTGFISQGSLLFNFSNNIKLEVGGVYYERNHHKYYNDNDELTIYHIQDNSYLHLKLGTGYSLVNQDNLELSILGGFLFGSRLSNHDMFYNSLHDTWTTNVDNEGRTPIPRNPMAVFDLGLDVNIQVVKSLFLKFKADLFRVIKGDHRRDFGASSNVYYGFGGEDLIINLQLGLAYKFNRSKNDSNGEKD